MYTIITLTDPKQYEYLRHVMESHARGGLPATELPIAADLYVSISRARQVDPEIELGPAKITEMGPSGIALEVDAAPTQQ